MKTLCCGGPNSFREMEPGIVERKAKSTTMVLTSMHEIHRTKLIPNAACRARHVHGEGRPTNTSEQRKQSLKDNSSKKLISELLALTMGVLLKRKKIHVITVATATPKRDKDMRMIPMISWYERNSSMPATQETLSLFGQ